MAIQLDHIALSVSDIERSAKFYYKMLGFSYEPIGLARISPTLVIQFIQRPVEASTHLAFSMTDSEFNDVLGRLKANGIPYGDNFDRVGTSSGPGRSHGSAKNAQCIYFTDPDGHMLEIMRYALR